MYSPSLVSNPRDDMNRFVICVADFVKEEYHTTMLHNVMNLFSLIVHYEFFEESKHSRISRNLKRGKSDEQNQPRFKKRAQN